MTSTKTNPITYRIALEIASHEAIVRQAYRNPGDVWTWSVGLTSATGHVVERYIGKPQSLGHCLRVYVWALDNYADEVRKVFTGIPLTEEEFGAALSFHWNTGAIGYASWVKLFKAGEKQAAKGAFMQWVKGPASLQDRRKAEAALLFEGKWSSRGVVTEYTRVKPSGAIDWESGQKVNIEAPLRAVLADEIPESDKVIVEAPQKNPTAAVTTAVGGTGAGAVLAAEPIARGLEAITTQQGELTSGDYVRIGVALVLVIGAVWLAFKYHTVPERPA